MVRPRGGNFIYTQQLTAAEQLSFARKAHKTALFLSPA